ncbi:MAG: hypothetical protein M3Q34_02840 [bacterium]|nr:hypothetical protein [bacterium]
MKQGIFQSIKKEWSASKNKVYQCRQGFSLVEIILSSALFSLLVVALVGAYLYGQESTMLAGNRARANMLAEEGLEAVRNIRDAGFSNLSDGTFGLTTTSNEWNLAGSSDITDIFTRQIIVSTIDTKRKLVTANITWQQNPQRTGSVSLATRITNWIASGIGNWSIPLQASQINIAGTQNGVKVEALGNYAYMVRTDGVPDFLVIDVSNPANPVMVGSLSLTGIPQNIFVSGNYAYVVNSDDNQELQIIDISVPALPTVVGTYNDAGTEDARGVFVAGTRAYLALNGGNDLVVVNVAVPTAPAFIGGLILNGEGYEVVQSSSHAYVTTSENTRELQVVNVSVPATPVFAGSLDLATTTDAIPIAITGSTVFLGQGTNFHTVNINVPGTPALLGTVGVLGALNDISLNLGNGNTYAFIATSHATFEFKVINVVNLATPVILGQFNVAGTSPLLGMAYDQALDRAFGVSTSDVEEFIVFAPQ